jgi:thiamine biosynthesis lipoprotein
VNKKIISILLVVVMVFSLSACSAQSEKRYEASFLELFDTVTTIVGYAKSKEDFSQYSQMIYDTLEEYNQLFDIYNDYEGINNIKTINDNAGIKPVKVDQKIIDLLLFSKEMYDLTEGKINIAFGSVLSLWHDHRTEGLDNPSAATLPDIEELKTRSNHTDINQMIIDEKASTVYLKDPDMRLDVGAIAKGYATEKVVKAMEEAGFVNSMISVGGNVRTLGNKFDEKGNDVPWGVGIQNPDLESADTTLHVLNLSGYSLVTSGVYERYYIVNGKQYHHIIDPETLMPTEYFASVSIVCVDSGLADALSTSIFNMPYEKGLELIEELDGVEAMWVFHDGTEQYSSGFEALINK